MAKPFLADRVSSVSTENTTNQTFVASEELVLPIHLNVTSTGGSFESKVENVYFIIGSCCMLGMIMQMVSWLCSGCKCSHSLQCMVGDISPSTLQSSQLQRSNKQLHLLVASSLLFCFAFLGFALDGTFGGLGMSFTVNTLGWTTDDASNLFTLYIVFMLLSSIVSILLAKSFQPKSLLIASAISCLAGTIFMASLIKWTQFSIWIRACLLGLGYRSMLANVTNASQRLPGQAPIISSIVIAGAFTGRLVAPQVIGYLLDHKDPMWFLYLCVLYSCCVFVISIVFPVVLHCSRRSENVEQKDCEVRLEKCGNDPRVMM